MSFETAIESVANHIETLSLKFMDAIEIENVINRLHCVGFKKRERCQINIKNARREVESLMRYFLGEKLIWQPEYDEVVKWLSDNKGDGILCSGNVGRGKSLLCANVIPILLNKYCGLMPNIFDASDLNEPSILLNAKKSKIVVIDDVGTESLFYGNPVFNEIVKRAENVGNCLIITTNLTSQDIKEKYGDRVLSRLLNICKCIKFSGEDLRLKNFHFLQK